MQGAHEESMNTVFRMEAKISWNVSQDAKSGAWVGVCDALGITALGETTEDLHASINDAMDGLFRDLLSDGELDEFLRQHGWKFQGDSQPWEDVYDDFKFDIPFEVIHANNQAHAGA